MQLCCFLLAPHAATHAHHHSMCLTPQPPRLGSGLHMQLRGDRPHVTGPLAAAVQMLNVSRVGQEPDLLGAEEDTRMLFRAGEEHAGAFGVGGACGDLAAGGALLA